MEKPVYPSPRAMASVFDEQRRRSRRRLFEFLLGVSREDFLKAVPAAGGKSLRDLLVHIIDTDGFWISLLQSRPHARPETDQFPTVESVVPFAEEISDRIHHVLSTADEDWFAREGVFSFPGGRVEKLIPAWVTLHMLTHEFHHKGQMMLAARSLGYSPPDLDFI